MTEDRQSPYLVHLGDLVVECPTAQHVVDLARVSGVRLEDVGQNGKHHHNPATLSPSNLTGQAGLSRWTEGRVAEFMRRLGPPQQKIIDSLYATADGRTDIELRQLLGVDGNKALAGTLSGLAKNAARFGFSSTDVYGRRDVIVGDQTVYEYSLNPQFRQALGKTKTK